MNKYMNKMKENGYKPLEKVDLNVVFGAIILKIYVCISLLIIVLLYYLELNDVVFTNETLLLYTNFFVWITLAETTIIVFNVLYPIAYNVVRYFLVRGDK